MTMIMVIGHGHCQARRGCYGFGGAEPALVEGAYERALGFLKREMGAGSGG